MRGYFFLVGLVLPEYSIYGKNAFMPFFLLNGWKKKSEKKQFRVYKKKKYKVSKLPVTWLCFLFSNPLPSSG